MHDNALRGERIESDDIVKFKVKKNGYVNRIPTFIDRLLTHGSPA